MAKNAVFVHHFAKFLPTETQNILHQVDLPQVYFVNQKKLGKGKLGKCRLITDDETDLGQVYPPGGLDASDRGL